MNLTQLFDNSLRGRRDQPGLEFQAASGGVERLTFGELEQRANRAAGVLRARGFARGDRLCLYLANSVEMIELFLACTRLGVIFVPINILYREREVRHIVEDADPRALIADGAVPHPGDVWQLSEFRAAAKRHDASRLAEPLDGDDPAAIIYTSGTTGTSKGAILTHNNFASNGISLASCWQFSEDDRLLLGLPLFHVHGLANGLHCWLASGCTLRLLERFEHQKAASLFLDFRPTVFFGVPTMYVRLLDLAPETSGEIGSSIRLFVSGSAPLPAQTLEDFQQRFGHRILERYGMTETLMNIGNPYFDQRRAGTVGLPLPGVSVEIRDPEGQPVGSDTEGELYVRGPNVFAGYWKKPDATAAAFSKAFFRTGDMGVRSADGYYTLRGRASDLIISGGYNIYPREIEEFLLEQPGVAECAVAASADRVRGEIPVAYVVANGEFDAARLEDACRKELASFKVPRAFVRVESLPRTALGKVQKHLLPRPD